jgi:hypothetical protein
MGRPPPAVKSEPRCPDPAGGSQERVNKEPEGFSVAAGLGPWGEIPWLRRASLLVRSPSRLSRPPALPQPRRLFSFMNSNSFWPKWRYQGTLGRGIAVTPYSLLCSHFHFPAFAIPADPSVRSACAPAFAVASGGPVLSAARGKLVAVCRRCSAVRDVGPRHLSLIYVSH